MPDEQPEDQGDFESPPSFFPYDEEAVVDGHLPGDYGEPVAVQVEAVFRTVASDTEQHFVLLTDSDRKLPIMIGPFEAASIAYALEGQHPDRPMTHDLFKNMLAKLDATLDRVVIDDLWGSTYYAKIYIRQGEDEAEIDSRPSDAIALAVRLDAPIFVADGILDQAQT